MPLQFEDTQPPAQGKTEAPRLRRASTKASGSFWRGKYEAKQEWVALVEQDVQETHNYETLRGNDLKRRALACHGRGRACNSFANGMRGRSSFAHRRGTDGQLLQSVYAAAHTDRHAALTGHGLGTPDCSDKRTKRLRI